MRTEKAIELNLERASSEPKLSASAGTSALARALRKILAKADLAGLNRVEIASVTTKELLEFSSLASRRACVIFRKVWS
jgi:hypothetical protein